MTERVDKTDDWEGESVVFESSSNDIIIIYSLTKKVWEKKKKSRIE